MGRGGHWTACGIGEARGVWTLRCTFVSSDQAGRCAPSVARRRSIRSLYTRCPSLYRTHPNSRLSLSAHSTSAPLPVRSRPESPHAIKAVVKFAQSAMGVTDVRITPSLNQAIWSRGIKSPPRRIRVRLERKRNDDEGAKEKLFVVASVVSGVTSFKVGPVRLMIRALCRVEG